MVKTLVGGFTAEVSEAAYAGGCGGNRGPSTPSLLTPPRMTAGKDDRMVGSGWLNEDEKSRYLAS